MTIEEKIFKKARLDSNKIVEYGFKKEKKGYTYSKNIMNNAFRVDILVNQEGLVQGKIYDLNMYEEYTNLRVEDITGSFVSQVREEFTNLLKDIRSKCFQNKLFIYEQSNRIAEAIKQKYHDDPNFEWPKFPGYATFKNANSQKWYGILMNIDKSKIEKHSSKEVEIINIKLDPEEIEQLLEKPGFYPAYHMNKKNWISILLDDTISDIEIMYFIAKSYAYTITNQDRGNHEWILPANPKYFDVEKALQESDTILWKQSTHMKVDDLVYLYITNPFSSIMYKLKIVKVHLPYSFSDKNEGCQQVMKLKLIKKYKKDQISLKKLNEFGIHAVRGPRYMPKNVSEYIDKI